MGNIIRLRNQFKSINTFERSYDYIYYEIGQEVQEEKIFKFRECTFCNFVIISQKGVAFPFEQT